MLQMTDVLWYVPLCRLESTFRRFGEHFCSGPPVPERKIATIFQNIGKSSPSDTA